MTKNEVVINYFDTFPLIQKNSKNDWVTPEFLGEGVIFAITDNPLGGGGVLHRDVVGNEIKGYSFMFSALFDYSADVVAMLENSKFFEELEYWIRDNNRKGILPEFNDGRKSLQIRVMQTPYLFMLDPGGKKAQYSIILQLDYKERR